MLDLNCSKQNLLVVACGIYLPDQGSNLGPLHWEPIVLTTGPPGKSLSDPSWTTGKRCMNLKNPRFKFKPCLSSSFWPCMRCLTTQSFFIGAVGRIKCIVITVILLRSITLTIIYWALAVYHAQGQIPCGHDLVCPLVHSAPWWWARIAPLNKWEGFPGGSAVKGFACQARDACRRCVFEPWVRKVPWRRKWQPTLVVLPGKSHGQRSPATVRGVTKESDST